ncbi:Casein kinase substrate [Abeliophyllum distichum]|uniref:Casein kinase substrate n=1 Tax=Abeliophyllum distichum TaxID=126358 RepID=A0ABD1UGR3_9LAMI
MGRGKFKGKPTGRRQFSTPEQMMAGTSASRPRTFRQEEAEVEEDERSEEESEEESDEESEKKKGTQGIIQVENPNLGKAKNLKARDVDMEKTTELSRHRLALIRQERAEAAKKREEEKAAREQKKLEARK